MSTTDIENPRAIAVLSLNHVGDVLFTTPAIAALKRRYPRAKIIAVTAANVAPILQHNPNIQEILVRRTRGFFETCKLAACLRQHGTDIVAIFSYSSFRLGLLAWLSGARRRIGFHCAPIKLFLTDCTINDPSIHQIETYLRVASLAGASGSLSPPQMFLTDDEKAWAKSFLESRGVKDEVVVGLNPGGTVLPNRWFPERFAAVSDMLADEGLKVIIFGSKTEISLAKQIADQMRSSPIIAAGETDLRQLASLIAACDIFISGDTGPLHMADALGVPSIGIYGPADPARTRPVDGRSIVIRREFPCGPCWRHPTCQNLDCLRAIQPSEVFQAILDLVGSGRPTAQISR